MITPATGETERAMPAVNCIGRTMDTVVAPNFAAMSGARLAKEKNAALPRPGDDGRQGHHRAHDQSHRRNAEPRALCRIDHGVDGTDGLQPGGENLGADDQGYDPREHVTHAVEKGHQAL